MKELTTGINLISHFEKIGNYGVNLTLPDFTAMVEPEPTLNELQAVDKKEADRILMDTLINICMIYLSVTPDESNKFILVNIAKSIMLDYGGKMSPRQVAHAFNMASRGKLETEIKSYGKIEHKMFMDLLREYCGKKHKAKSAARQEAEKKAEKEAALPFNDGMKYLFDDWEERQKDGFLYNENRYYAASYAKSWVKLGFLNLSDEQMEIVMKNLKEGNITMNGWKSEACGINEEDGTILFHKIKAPIPIQRHENFSGMEFDDIYIFCLLFAYWKNEIKTKGI